MIEQLVDESGVMKEVHIWPDPISSTLDVSPDASAATSGSGSSSDPSFSSPPRRPICVPATHLFDKSHLLRPTEHEYECCYCGYGTENSGSESTCEPNPAIQWVPIPSHLPPQPGTSNLSIADHIHPAPFMMDTPSVFYMAPPSISLHPQPITPSSSSSSSTTSSSLNILLHSAKSLNNSVSCARSSEYNSSESYHDFAPKSDAIFAKLPLNEIHMNSAHETVPTFKVDSTALIGGNHSPVNSLLYSNSSSNDAFKSENTNYDCLKVNQCSECAQYLQQMSTYTTATNDNRCFQCDSSRYCDQCDLDHSICHNQSLTSVSKDCKTLSSIQKFDRDCVNSELQNQSLLSTLPAVSPCVDASDTIADRLTLSPDTNVQLVTNTPSSLPFWNRHSVSSVSNNEDSTNRRSKKDTNPVLNSSPESFDYCDVSRNAPNTIKIHSRPLLISHHLKSESSREKGDSGHRSQVTGSLKSIGVRHVKTLLRNGRANADDMKSNSFSSLVRKLNKSNLNCAPKHSFSSIGGDELIVKSMNSEVKAPTQRSADDEPDDGYEDDDMDRKSSISPASFVQRNSCAAIPVNVATNQIKIIRAEDLEAEAVFASTKTATDTLLNTMQQHQASQSSLDARSSVIDKVFQSVLQPNVRDSSSTVLEIQVKNRKSGSASRQSSTLKTNSVDQRNRKQDDTKKERKSTRTTKNERDTIAASVTSNVQSSFQSGPNTVNMLPVKQTVATSSSNFSNNVATSKVEFASDNSCAQPLNKSVQQTLPDTHTKLIKVQHQATNESKIDDDVAPDSEEATNLIEDSSLSNERPLRMSSLPIRTAFRLICTNVLPGRVRLRWTWLDEFKPLQKTDFLVELSRESNNGHWRIAHQCSAHQCRLNNLQTGVHYRFRVRTIAADQQLISDTLTVRVPSSYVNSNLLTSSNASFDSPHSNGAIATKASTIGVSGSTDSCLPSHSKSFSRAKSIGSRQHLKFNIQSYAGKLRSLLNRLLSQQLFAFFFLILFAFISCAIAFSFQKLILAESW